MNKLWLYRLAFVGLLTLFSVAQVYLLARGWQWVRRSSFSPRNRRWVLAGLGAFFFLVLLPYPYLVLVGILSGRPAPQALSVWLYPYAVWCFGSFFTALFLVLRDTGRCLQGRWKPVPPSGSGGPAFSPSRRRFLGTAFGVLATAPIVASAYGATYGREEKEVTDLTLAFPHLPPELDGLRVVHLSDLHLGPFLDAAALQEDLARVAALRPHLVVVTGDFLSTAVHDLRGFREAMAAVRPPLGVYGCLGNHEYFTGDLTRVIRTLAEAGVTVLANQAVRLRIGPCRLGLAGVEDLRMGTPDLEAALREAPPFTILLSHRPEIFPAAAARGIPLILSGHYHGGQVALRLGGLSLSAAHLATPYPEGLFIQSQSYLYVNRGLGTTGTPVRLNAPPEITRITLRRGAAPPRRRVRPVA